MGLDGISVNQLRVVQESNSSELNNINKNNQNETHKVVDGLNQGQKINPDQEKEKNSPDFFDDFNDDEENNSEVLEQPVEIIKYDLSDSGKYILKLDESGNNILIVESTSSKVVQKINADELSKYVGFLSDSQGSIVNRKF